MSSILASSDPMRPLYPAFPKSRIIRHCSRFVIRCGKILAQIATARWPAIATLYWHLWGGLRTTLEQETPSFSANHSTVGRWFIDKQTCALRPLSGPLAKMFREPSPSINPAIYASSGVDKDAVSGKSHDFNLRNSMYLFRQYGFFLALISLLCAAYLFSDDAWWQSRHQQSKPSRDLFRSRFGKFLPLSGFCFLHFVHVFFIQPV
jgi:hypothetical protein